MRTRHHTHLLAGLVHDRVERKSASRRGYTRCGRYRQRGCQERRSKPCVQSRTCEQHDAYLGRCRAGASQSPSQACAAQTDLQRDNMRPGGVRIQVGVRLGDRVGDRVGVGVGVGDSVGVISVPIRPLPHPYPCPFILAHSHTLKLALSRILALSCTLAISWTLAPFRTRRSALSRLAPVRMLAGSS